MFTFSVLVPLFCLAIVGASCSFVAGISLFYYLESHYTVLLAAEQPTPRIVATEAVTKVAYSRAAVVKAFEDAKTVVTLTIHAPTYNFAPKKVS
jgi:hypothetical protein